MVRGLALVALSVLLSGCGGWYIGVAKHEDRRTPLEIAAQGGDLKQVQRLLASGADPNDRNGAFGSPLNSAALRAHNDAVIRALIAAGADPNGRGADRVGCWAPPVWHAAYTGDPENTRALLDSGASIADSGCSKVIVGWLKPSVIDLLQQHGLNVLAIDERGRNELHLALAPPVVPNFDGIEYLVRAGVPVNARDGAGKTPLAYWREPRDYEAHPFRTWLFDRLADDPGMQQQRVNRAKISDLLKQAGATL